MDKWQVVPVRVATRTFYQPRRVSGDDVETAGGYYERESIAQRLCDVLNEEEVFEDDYPDEF